MAAKARGRLLVAPGRVRARPRRRPAPPSRSRRPSTRRTSGALVRYRCSIATSSRRDVEGRRLAGLEHADGPTGVGDDDTAVDAPRPGCRWARSPVVAGSPTRSPDPARARRAAVAWCQHAARPDGTSGRKDAVLDGRDEPPTVGAMAQLVSEIAATRPDVAALIDERGTTTWEQLAGRVNRLINALRAAGVGQGDTVAMLSQQPAGVLRGLPGRRSHGRADRPGELALGGRRGGLRAGQLRCQGAAGGGRARRRGRRRPRRAARRHPHRRRRRGRGLPALRGRAGRGRRHRAGRPGPGRPDVLHVGHHRLAQGRAQRHARAPPCRSTSSGCTGTASASRCTRRSGA